MQDPRDFSFKAKLRLWSGGKQPSSRHFVTLPKDLSTQIKAIAATMPRRGRGSVKITARIGFVSRDTSIFPDNKIGSYILPIKSAIRKELDIGEGSAVLVYLKIK